MKSGIEEQVLIDGQKDNYRCEMPTYLPRYEHTTLYTFHRLSNLWEGKNKGPDADEIWPSVFSRTLHYSFWLMQIGVRKIRRPFDD